MFTFVSVVLCRYRPFEGLIPHSRSFTKYLNIYFSRINHIRYGSGGIIHETEDESENIAIAISV
jgi:hypothetical protein